jgi:hypothetical protein
VFCNHGGFTMAAAFVINTGLQPSAYRVKRFQPFQRLSSLGVIK